MEYGVNPENNPPAAEAAAEGFTRRFVHHDEACQLGHSNK